MRVYIASYLLNGDIGKLEISTQDDPAPEEIKLAVEALQSELPEGAVWEHAPSENNYFLKSDN